MRKIILLLFISTIGLAQDKEIPLGKITDSLSISGDRGTYAVYLPTTYSEEKKWPVIMVFDPSGRGELAVSHFIEASERYGYIIAGSNNIKNATYQENFNIARAFYAEVLSRYSTDENGIYLGGFSGGARLASAIAVISKNIKGVLACGASFANNNTYIPKRNSFLYVGIVGDEDFNYREMKSADDYLNKLKFDSDLLIFSEGHVWPPKHFITKGVRLLTLKSMTRNILPKNEEKIKQFYTEDLEFNRDLVKRKEMLYAYRDLEAMKENYRFYFEKDSLKDLQKEVKRSKKYRTQRNSQYYVDEIEPSYYMDYLNYLPRDIAAAELESLGYWEGEINSLNKDFINSPDPAKQKMGKRLISFLTVVPSELEASYNEEENLHNLLYINIFKTIITPKEYDAYLKVLKYTVKNGDYGMALFYLEKMLKNDFKDVDRLNNQEGITLLRIQPEYNDLLEAYGLETMY